MSNILVNNIIYYYEKAKSELTRDMIKYVGEQNYFNKVHKYASSNICPAMQSHAYIKKCISEGSPFMAGRFGSSELYMAEVFDLKYTKKYDNALKQLIKNSGFFPYDINNAFEFKNLMLESCIYVDVMAAWMMPREAYYIKHYMKPDIYLTQLRQFEPWTCSNPWTTALEGKKVLVIHPFTDTIQRQYERRKEIFVDNTTLPQFDLKTLKAVQTIAEKKDERFKTWFDALEYMYNEALKIDFDIALIGCGAYGFPLAAKLKKAGKQAIHMGGILQILFGIKGNRWDDDPIVSKLYNEYWVRPGEDEKPAHAENIENGCYW